MTQNGVDFEVQIEAGVDLATGQVYASFSSIVPGTGLPPNVLTGFLPPEDGTGRGQGYFSYIIDHVAGLTTGTEIRNIALIQFDRQQSIATNQVDPLDPTQGTDPEKEAFNTIDAGLPSSQVDPLSGTTDQTDFAFFWSGVDDLGGSGVGSYDIYVSDDGSDFALWLDNTTDTSAIYTGENGHTYAFYSIAVR